jgi:hypothetical protein
MTLSQKKGILFHLLKSTFLMRAPVRVIKDGQFQQDYFLLKKKPSLGCLFIHQDSAAVTRQADGSLQALPPGYHYLNAGEEILLSFNLKLQKFVYGPDKNENPFELKRSGENYTDFHARQLNAQKVRSYSKDSRASYPSFKISYQVDMDSILPIAAFLVKNNMTGEANTYINELLGKRAATLWADLLSDTTSDELFSDNSEKSVDHLLEKINQTLTTSHSGKMASSGNGTFSGDISDWKFSSVKVYLNDLKMQPNGRD